MTIQVDLPHLYSGKVRDMYDAGDDRLLLVTSDRISAFDVVMAEPITDKGRVLTAMSAFWFEHLADVAGSHLISTDLADLPEGAHDPELAGRVMLCRRAEMLPIECIVRGYLTGSAWKEYRASGTMHGTELPAGLLESSALPEPVFTPSTKAEIGDHDENISFDRAVELVGPALAEQARSVSLELYRRGAAWAAERGVIIADTKFELGLVDGELVVADEVLTPDSSRFWPADEWRPGSTPPSFDKQPLRDYLDGPRLGQEAPAPAAPARGGDRHAATLRRGPRADHGPVLPGLARGVLISSPTPVPPATVAWVEDVVGPGHRVVGVAALDGATSSAVHAVTTADRRGERHHYVLRRYTRADWLAREPDLAEREAEALVLVESVGVPTPVLVAADVAGERTDVPAVLMTRLPGAAVPAAELGDRRVAALARLLPVLHATRGAAAVRPARPIAPTTSIGSCTRPRGPPIPICGSGPSRSTPRGRRPGPAP